MTRSLVLHELSPANDSTIADFFSRSSPVQYWKGEVETFVTPHTFITRPLSLGVEGSARRQRIISGSLPYQVSTFHIDPKGRSYPQMPLPHSMDFKIPKNLYKIFMRAMRSYDFDAMPGIGFEKFLAMLSGIHASEIKKSSEQAPSSLELMLKYFSDQTESDSERVCLDDAKKLTTILLERSDKDHSNQASEKITVEATHKLLQRIVAEQNRGAFFRPDKDVLFDELVTFAKEKKKRNACCNLDGRGVLGTISLTKSEADFLYGFFPTGGGSFMVQEAKDMLECERLLAKGDRLSALRIIQAKLRKFTSEGVSIRAYSIELPSVGEDHYCVGAAAVGYESFKLVYEDEEKGTELREFGDGS